VEVDLPHRLATAIELGMILDHGETSESEGSDPGGEAGPAKEPMADEAPKPAESGPALLLRQRRQVRRRARRRPNASFTSGQSGPRKAALPQLRRRLRNVPQEVRAALPRRPRRNRGESRSAPAAVTTTTSTSRSSPSAA
jgi:hypothetical protein